MKEKIHDLKTWPEMFGAVITGQKTAEYRKNDRNFKQGEYLNLREWLPDAQEYTDCSLLAKITHIAYGGQFGIPKDYCVMSIKLES